MKSDKVEGLFVAGPDVLAPRDLAQHSAKILDAISSLARRLRSALCQSVVGIPKFGRVLETRI